MPTPFEELVDRVCDALSVDDSYKESIIPYGIKRAGKRLLRDYHFPWAVDKETYVGLGAGKQDYTLPVGFKKELAVMFFDTEELTFSEPLLKREGFVRPHLDGIPRAYWLWNGNLSTDIILGEDVAATTNLILWFENLDWDANETWMLARFEDVLFTYAVFRIAAEKQKKELAETFGVLWADDRTALAKYANELEFDNSEFIQREAQPRKGERYPI